MLKNSFVAAATMLGCGLSAAQSSVTIYGLVDEGITHTNRTTANGGKGSDTQLISGSSQGSRLGFKGSEDLGGGTKALFVLESGFDVSTGQTLQGGRMFGRGSYVGLSGGWGELTLGRQYDFMGWFLPAYAIGANTPAGLLAWGLPSYSAGGYSLDNRVWGDWVDNSIKYVTPTIGGFSGGAMYGFGETIGNAPKSNTMSLVANYDNGGFGSSVSYYSQQNAVGGSRKSIVAGGMGYSWDKFRVFGLVSDVRIHSEQSARATTADIGAVFNIVGNLFLGGGYQHQWRSDGLPDGRQVTASLDYKLSARTDVYTVAALGKDEAFGAQTVAALGAPSPTASQFAFRVGLRHKF